MTTLLTLQCPIRGPLKASAKSADGLTPSEEKFRVDAIRYLLTRGYPAENFRVEAVVKRFGHKGKNSLRADIAVLDAPVATLPSDDVDELLAHTVLLGEVKRDNRDYEQAKKTQVKPMLDFAARLDCVALYWDNSEQRVFWKELEGGVRVPREGPIGNLPDYGNKILVEPLTFDSIEPTDSLARIFDRIEDILHGISVPQSKRYKVMLQLLLAKLFDEHSHEKTPDDPLGIQDTQALGTPPDLAVSRFNAILRQAVGYYGTYLPEAVEEVIPLDGHTLSEVLRLLAPVKIIASKHSVVQDFYMRFAKGLYRWELGQYFTPATVTDFIVEILNPQFGEHVKDPACGSADFLTAAYRIGKQVDPSYAAAVWGADNSSEAVQVAVLNMLLNGDGKTNIVKEDSLEAIGNYDSKYDIIVCNPPFGTKIVESRQKVLREYALGHVWELKDGFYEETDKLLKKQQVGLLFAEACVRQAKPGGRIGIILPNGYLGNRSATYVAFREWLLRNCRVAAICAFPRFTFKASGADVSASITYLEKRRVPLEHSSNDDEYRLNVEVIEKVGWNVGDKRGKPQFLRDAEDGSYIVGEDGELIVDADFKSVLSDIRNSEAANFFLWLRKHGEAAAGSGWSISVREVLGEPTLCLDPKRHCRKASDLRKCIGALPHFRLGDSFDLMPERTSSQGTPIVSEPSASYHYVEIDDISLGDYTWTELRGWQLPDRARHFAEPGDIYVGSIWGSVSKWFYAPTDCARLVVTNGCHRLRPKPGHEERVVDLVASLCSEAYSTQMRSLARGSDGLAEISSEDAYSVLIPLVTKQAAREDLEPFIERLRDGRARVQSRVRDMIDTGALPIPTPPERPNHTVLV